MKKNKIFTMLIIGVFLFSSLNIENVGDVNQKNIKEPQDSAGWNSDIYVDYINFTQTRGNDFLDFELGLHSYTISEGDNGCPAVSLDLLTDDDEDETKHVYRVSNGTVESSSHFLSRTLEPTLLDTVNLNLTGTSDYYIIPTNDFYFYPSHDQADGSNYWEIYYSGGTYSHLQDYRNEVVYYTYEFHPIFNIISIDSIFDNTNTYIKILDEFTDVWTEFRNYEDVVIYHPEYKLRVYETATDALIFEDEENQKFSYFQNTLIDCIKLTNNYEEPIFFELEGADPLSQRINPFNSLVIFYDNYTDYTVEDLYGNTIDDGGSVNTQDELIYTPPYEDSVYLKYIDQNELTLNYNDFRTEINFSSEYIPILNQLFLAERNSTIYINVYDLQSNLLTNDSLFIEPGLNYKNIIIPVLYIENNSPELIIAYLFNESSVPTDFYTYSYENSDYESYENSSYIETFGENSFVDNIISFENNSDDCPSLSVSYSAQVDINENNTFMIYPIETSNEIALVKFWDNVTLDNITLTESGGYYNHTINSSYSTYYSVEIYIEDSAGNFKIMEIDNIFVLKNRIRINLENLQNKYIQDTDLNVSASLYTWDGTLTSETVNFTLQWPNGTVILEDQSPYLEYTFGYTCDYYRLTAEYFGDLDNLEATVETIFEVIPPPDQSNTLIYFDEDPIFNITINPFSTEFNNMMTSFNGTEVLWIICFDIYNNQIFDEVFNFSTKNIISYTPEIKKDCLIILKDQYGNYLNFNNYLSYIDSSAIYDSLLQKTVGTNLTIEIKDLFGNSLLNSSYVVSRNDNFIILEIEQFSVKIFNMMKDSTELNITNSEVIIREYIAVDELISLFLTSGTYDIDYIDDSNVEHSLSLNINQSKLIVLNSTYRQVHFAFFDLSGLGLDPDTARFYINSERRDIGKNWVQGDNCSIDVLDYFNETLYSESISLVGLTEYNIYLPVYTMIIHNNYSTSMELSIQRIGNGIEFRTIISDQDGFPIRLLANVEYGIHMYYTNGSLAESKTVLLNENYKQISFGDYEEIILVIPGLVQTETNDWIIAVSIISLIAFIAVIVVIFLINKFNTKTKYEIVNIPSKNFMG